MTTKRNNGRWYENEGGEGEKRNGRNIGKMKRKSAWGIREEKLRSRMDNKKEK